jgi:hypothetical protein
MGVMGGIGFVRRESLEGVRYRGEKDRMEGKKRD